MLAELGHSDIFDALRHAEEMRSALRVIHTWAGVPGALDARHVLDLTAKALRMGANVLAQPTGKSEAFVRSAGAHCVRPAWARCNGV